MSLRLLHGDCRTVLPTLPEASVQCVVTSPPYWGLRDYGVAGQLGLEATPEEYVARMVEVFRAVRRVLRADGTCWVNMGDCYANNGACGGSSPIEYRKPEYGRPSKPSDHWDGRQSARQSQEAIASRIPPGLKPKDLVGMPWRLAFALQADGWFLRADIVWAKPNPMPESVTDRPTKAHEYVFLLAKGQWSSRVIQFTDLPDEFCHLSNHRRLQASDSWLRRLCVRLASAILDATQIEHNFCLPPFESEIRQEGASNGDGVPIGDGPEIQRAAMLAARFLRAQASTKEFLGELHRLWVALPDADDLLKAWVPAVVADAPGIYRYGNGTVAIKHTGQVCQLDLTHGCATIARPTGCSYFYDADAVREAHTGPPVEHYGTLRSVESRDLPRGVRGSCLTARPREYNPAGHNLRSVWTIAPEPYPEAHFATFAPELARRCIVAGTSAKGACATCGAPWAREVERDAIISGNGRAHIAGGDSTIGVGWEGTPRASLRVTTLGWRPTCAHAAAVVPCTVLDPFAGSGTVGEVAERNGRNAILIELSPAYVELARARTAQRGLFATRDVCAGS